MSSNFTRPDQPLEQVTICAIMGWVNLSFGLVFAAMSGICIVTIRTSKELYERASYRFMFVGSIMEFILQWGIIIVPGIMLICYNASSVLFQKIFGAIANGTWSAYIYLVFFLSINRVIIIYSNYFSDLLFAKWKVWIWTGGAVVLGVCWTVLFLCPSMDVWYSLEWYYWAYSPNPVTNAAMTAQAVIDQTLCGLTVFSFLIVSIGVCWKRYQVSQQTLSLVERKALVSAFAMAMTLAICMFFWNAGIFGSNPYWIAIGNNLVTVCYFGSNAIIYILLNGSIRHEVVRLFKEGMRRDHIQPTLSAQARIGWQANMSNEKKLGEVATNENASSNACDLKMRESSNSATVSHS